MTKYIASVSFGKDYLEKRTEIEEIGMGMR